MRPFMHSFMNTCFLRPVEDLWLHQREKPINEHMISQLLFYCEMNHKKDHAHGKCSGRPELMVDQGMASDWIKAEHDVFQEKLRLREREEYAFA